MSIPVRHSGTKDRTDLLHGVHRHSQLFGDTARRSGAHLHARSRRTRVPTHETGNLRGELHTDIFPARLVAYSHLRRGFIMC